AEYIMAANPATFTDVYDPRKFCYDVSPSLELNAYAAASTITVNIGTLKGAFHDAEIAAVLSHELAHITMQHGDTVHPKLGTNEVFKRLNQELEDLETSIRPDRTRISREGASVREEHARLVARESAGYPAAIGSLSSEFEEKHCAIIRSIWTPDTVELTADLNALQDRARAAFEAISGFFNSDVEEIQSTGAAEAPSKKIY